jgi:DNA replication protein DnaC
MVAERVPRAHGPQETIREHTKEPARVITEADRLRIEAFIASQKAAAARREERQEQRPPDREQREKRVRAGLEEIGIPRRFWSATWDNIPATLPASWGEDVKRYCDGLAQHVGQGAGLYLGGDLGVGKTCLLALIARVAWEQEVSCVYVECGMVLAQLIFNSLDDWREDDIGWPYRDKALVLLDDLDDIRDAAPGAANPSLQAICRWLKWRHAHRRATVIASNRSWNDLVAIPEFERMADRWKENMPIRLETGIESQRRCDPNGSAIDSRTLS